MGLFLLLLNTHYSLQNFVCVCILYILTHNNYYVIIYFKPSIAHVIRSQHMHRMTILIIKVRANYTDIMDIHDD